MPTVKRRSTVKNAGYGLIQGMKRKGGYHEEEIL
jgi:hypothetical protein